MCEPLERARIEFEGIVQGVGFRPFLHRLAEELNLQGWVLNSSAGVLLELEGSASQLAAFVERAKTQAPPLSKILVARMRKMEVMGYHGFSIKPSRQEAGALTLLCPDVAVCSECLQEMSDPSDRRYRYPFINCTNCGPRYTIVRGLPYDRPLTTMAGFPLCDSCSREYEDVQDRRYHAQPVACPVCGPHLWLESPAGEIGQDDPLDRSISMIRSGALIAIKGLGGFHLACRADQDDVVLKLRYRKQRSFFKPLAVMLRNLEEAREICEIDAAAAAWLVSPAAPIVLLPVRPGALGGVISRFVAPNLQRLGIMLPYTPLHHLLLEGAQLPLVMTSGNISDEPIIADNETARSRLSVLVDGLLLHNRPIHARCDDSVLAADASGGCTMLRHSRGFSPFPIALPNEGPDVLALGGDIKTTFAASRGRFAFLSPHLGDADQLATYELFRETWDHYRRLFDLHPQAIACDLHPGYHTARWAKELADQLGVPLLKAQHHHAHLVSLLTELGMSGPQSAIVADGVGYGIDGTIWGGELLFGDEYGFERLRHLKPIMLPGGDAATREPWRIALALLHAADPAQIPRYTRGLLSGKLTGVEALPAWRLRPDHNPRFMPPTPGEVDLVLGMLGSSVNTIPSTALGRLFDGIAALTAVTLYTTYEGQAPMELEALAETSEGQPPQLTAKETELLAACPLLDWTELVKLYSTSTLPAAQIAYHFHTWVCRQFIMALNVDKPAVEHPVVLASGGCMQNSLLKSLLARACAETGRKIVVHREIPAGDGGLALGVLRIAQAQLVGRR